MGGRKPRLAFEGTECPASLTVYGDPDDPVACLTLDPYSLCDAAEGMRRSR
ncbi:hypothetical protein ACFY7C_25725 [Streptomyces sp. NPDC012769]|uniref:hypothetical protein n=1 Tax=Streptomyces sp. NPDC012769 TaxID=3364848 RepID=UPI0036A4D41A